MTINKLLEEELVQTNNIENIHTDRNSVRILINGTHQPKQYKEQQIVEQYIKVLNQEISIQSPE